jgi:transaldolase
MPEVTLKALANHEEFGEALTAHADEVLAEFAKAGIDTDAVAVQLLEEGVASFAKSWDDLLACIASKSEKLKAA